jgi:hypothetical protein
MNYLNLQVVMMILIQLLYLLLDQLQDLLLELLLTSNQALPQRTMHALDYPKPLVCDSYAPVFTLLVYLSNPTH